MSEVPNFIKVRYKKTNEEALFFHEPTFRLERTRWTTNHLGQFDVVVMYGNIDIRGMTFENFRRLAQETPAEKINSFAVLKNHYIDDGNEIALDANTPVRITIFTLPEMPENSNRNSNQSNRKIQLFTDRNILVNFLQVVIYLANI
jgi:hypothetical protein